MGWNDWAHHQCSVDESVVVANAATFASWGVDYLKLDGCNVYVPSGETTEQAYREAYTAESTALAGAGRSIVFSESAPAYFQSGEWG